MPGRHEVSGHLLYAQDGKQSKFHGYVYLSGSLVAKRSVPVGGGAASVRYQHTDGLGSLVAASDEAGTVVRRERMTAYGEPVDGAWDNGHGFTGHQNDAATELVYMQQRYYDPAVGRFVSADPVSAHMGNGWNYGRYKYAANNPFTYVDPDGRQEKEKRDYRSICEHQPTRCQSGGGGSSRANASQNKAYEKARGDESSRQSLINRLHRAGNFKGPAPKYDPSLIDDAGRVDAVDGTVTIGPSAFFYENAADLGSVIFHELVPHSEQFQNLSDFLEATHDNRVHVLEYEAHSRTLSSENPFSGRMSPTYRSMAENEMVRHRRSMNATNGRLVDSGQTCSTGFCSGD